MSSIRIPSNISLPELTLRGCIVAALITIVFTAANIYLGLKVGLTFSSAIPAAVISMAVLRVFKDSNILENTMVQSFASAAGTLSSIIFILPGLIMVGFWRDFPFWHTALLCMLGGVLGVMYSIPLRRALVVQSTLPYPEGRAAAEILRVASHGVQQETIMQQQASGAKHIMWGGLLAGIFTLLSRGAHLFAHSISVVTKFGTAAFGIGTEFSLALLGAGYLVGIRIGIALLFGTLISWWIALPILSVLEPMPETMQLADHVHYIWSTKVRFIGVGTIAVAAIYTLLQMLPAIGHGIRSAFTDLIKVRRGFTDHIERTEYDIPITYVLWTIALLSVPLAFLLVGFIDHSLFEMPDRIFMGLSIMAAVFILFFGFIIAAVSGYMAGLVGSSNSPVSSLGILAVISIALLIAVFWPMLLETDLVDMAVAVVIFSTAGVIAVAAIANDNLQDLKTGQLVGATPWKQQLALVFGVLVGALVIPIILQILYYAYGFPGALPNADMDPRNVLNAPQAVLMSALAQGILSGELEWDMVAVGAVIAVLLLLFNIVLRYFRHSRITLIAVGMGVYLPPEIITAIAIGSIISWTVKRYAKRKEEAQLLHQRGVLFASGLIVGESLIGVLIALLIISTANHAPLALVGDSFAGIARWLGLLAFIFGCVAYYLYVTRKGSGLYNKL